MVMFPQDPFQHFSHGTVVFNDQDSVFHDPLIIPQRLVKNRSGGKYGFVRRFGL
jgi:hypothetical protein